MRKELLGKLEFEITRNKKSDKHEPQVAMRQQLLIRDDINLFVVPPGTFKGISFESTTAYHLGKLYFSS